MQEWYLAGHLIFNCRVCSSCYFKTRLSACVQETAVAPRQRSPVPRRPALDRRSSPPKPDLSPSTSNHDRWSHDGEASDAAAAIAQNERLAADEAKQQQIAEEQAAAEEAERTRQAERARLEAASERQRLADQRRILEKAEKQLQSEKHAVKQAAEEAERQRVAAEERRLALERKQAAASHELSRKPSLHERISLRPNASSRPKDKRQRSPSVVRSQTFSSSDTYSRSPSVDRRDRQTSTAGHRKHGGRLRSISPPRWKAQFHRRLVLHSYVRSRVRLAIGCQDVANWWGSGLRLVFLEVQTCCIICKRQYTWFILDGQAPQQTFQGIYSTDTLHMNCFNFIGLCCLFIWIHLGRDFRRAEKNEATGKQFYAVPVGPKLYRFLLCECQLMVAM